MSETTRKDDKEAREELEKLRKELTFWRSEVTRINANWTKTWQAFQQQYNEKDAEVKLLIRVLESKDKEQVYG